MQSCLCNLVYIFSHLLTISFITVCQLIVGPIPWGHIGPLCHALSLSSSSSSLSSSLALSWTSMRRRRATVQWRHLVNWREAAKVAVNGHECQIGHTHPET